jgi:amino-acid N-acetyltransferase
MSVLGSSATKREARSYLQRFTPSKTFPSLTTKPPSSPTPETAVQTSYNNGVNLGGFYGPAAVAQSPKFGQQPEKQVKPTEGPQLHIALVKIRDPQHLDDDTLYGIGKTLSQLGRLGLISAVVIDCNEGSSIGPNPDANWRTLATGQANRIVAAIDANSETGARLVDNVIGVSEKDVETGVKAFTQGKTNVKFRKLLMTPLRRGVIPVIPSVGYSDATQTAIPVKASDVVLALTRELAGLQPANLPDEDPDAIRERLQALRNEVSLDRLIILDPLGGIPTSDRPNGYHVFLNMEQEFEPAKRDLLMPKSLGSDGCYLRNQLKENRISDLGSSNPLSKFVETEFGPGPSGVSNSTPKTVETPCPNNLRHLENLELVRWVLAMLPRSSSALLTTPEEAANSGKQPDTPFQAAGVGTRRQQNPLIHNLLTDKPVFSSSLPMGRLASSALIKEKESFSPAASITQTTFAKHGMSVTIFPDPKIIPWEPPIPGKPHMTLSDSHIDLPRLVHLIEDSFGRKLDVKDFLKRVNGRIAGVIIAGEYEGGALLTWETPPGVVDDGSLESRARMVPYLDKFAVLKKSQGAGGHADLLFKAMVRDCFPSGCVWRSRKDNAVNKWYFERSRGTWKLPGTNWTMFWTTPDLSMDKQLFRDYEAVCRGVVPSWAD